MRVSILRFSTIAFLFAIAHTPSVSGEDINPEKVKLIVRLFDKRDEVFQVELRCHKDEIFDLNSITKVNGKKINFADKTAKIELIKGPAWEEGDRVVLVDQIKKDGVKVTIKAPGQHNLNTVKDNLPSGNWADRVAGIHFKLAGSKD